MTVERTPAGAAPGERTPGGGQGSGAFRGDAHVHLYPEFDTPRFLDTAASRTARGSGEDRAGSPAPFLFLFTESRGHDAFRRLRDEAGRGTTWSARGGPLALRAVENGRSLQVIRVDAPGDPPAWLIAGRQVISREDLEVLLLAAGPDDGLVPEPDRTLSAAAVLERGLEAGAAAGLPWGLGKWLGARGRHVCRLVERPELAGHRRFFLGDIAARCPPWPRPGVFRGATVLPGTDVLPVAGAEAGIGSYGFEMAAPFDAGRPAASFLAALEAGAPVRPIGRRQSPLAVIREQVLFRRRKARDRTPEGT